MLKSYKEKEEKEARDYPEINQSLKVLNEAGEWVVGREKEQLIAYPIGFVFSGIIGNLNATTVKILCVICSFNNRFRNTTATNKMIGHRANICRKTVKKALKELEFYHIITRHNLPGGSLKNKKRCINISRWDTAIKKLIREKKIIPGLDNKINFLVPNPYKKK
jgi:superfamily II helicase